MYIKIIYLSLLIAFSESSFFGVSYPEVLHEHDSSVFSSHKLMEHISNFPVQSLNIPSDTPLRRIMPIMMEANSNFAAVIKQGLQNMPVEVPCNIQNDDFMTAMVQDDDFSLNVKGIKLIETSDCRFVEADATLFTLSVTTTIYCKAIYFEGSYEVCGESDQSIFVKLEKVKININVDLKLKGHILVIERAVAKIPVAKGSVKAPKVTEDMIDTVFSSLFKDVLQKKMMFYFKKAVEDILTETLGSISITDSLRNDYYAISTLNSANRGLSKMANGVLDKQQAKFLQSNCKNGYYPVKNLNLTFTQKFFLITYEGTIRLTDGSIGNLKTFEKVGSLAFFGSPANGRFVLLLKVRVGNAICNFEHMYTTIWGYRFIYLGGVKASLNAITAEVAVDVSLDVLGFVAEVNEVVLYIPNIGRLKTQIRSFGTLLGFLASFMQSLVTDLFHSIFAWIFERKIENVLVDMLVGRKLELMAAMG